MCETSERMCRICRGGEEADHNDEGEIRDPIDSCGPRFEPLISPCSCKGSCALVHGPCIQAWLSSRPALNTSCEVCHATYKLKWRSKPLRDWRSPTFGQEDLVKIRLSAISCLLTIADVLFCASSVTHRPTYFFASPTLHGLLLLMLTVSWTYCIGINLLFWLQLIQQWRRQNLELSI